MSQTPVATTTCHGYAARDASSPLAPHTFTRRALRSDDVSIEIRYCGVCHSDLHQVRNDWRNTLAKGHFAHHGFAHVTAPPSRFRTFPAYLPMGSLDKAYSRGALRIHHARVVHNPLVRDASDHLPLVIDFHLVGT